VIIDANFQFQSIYVIDQFKRIANKYCIWFAQLLS